MPIFTDYTLDGGYSVLKNTLNYDRMGAAIYLRTYKSIAGCRWRLLKRGKAWLDNNPHPKNLFRLENDT